MCPEAIAAARSRALFNAMTVLMATPGGDKLRFPGKCEAGEVSPYPAGSLSPL